MILQADSHDVSFVKSIIVFEIIKLRYVYEPQTVINIKAKWITAFVYNSALSETDKK